MRRLLDRLYAALMALAAAALAAAFGAVMLGIADRQLALGLRGLDAWAGYAVAAALFLALPATLQRGEHIRVTLVLQRLAPRLQAALEWWCLAAGALLATGLAGYAIRLVWVSYTTHDVSQGSDATPLWLPQTTMALGCAGLALAFADAAASRMCDRRFYRDGGDAAAHAE